MEQLTKNIMGLISLWNLLTMLLLILHGTRVLHDFFYLSSAIVIALLATNAVMLVGGTFVSFKFGKNVESK